MQYRGKGQIYNVNQDLQLQSTPKIKPANALGYLLVQAFAGGRSFPVPNATVTVYDASGQVAELLTDASGQTTQLTLPAWPAAAAVQPEDNATRRPAYTVRITHPDYTSTVIHNVVLYEGVVSRQATDLFVRGTAPDGRTQIDYTVQQALQEGEA